MKGILKNKKILIPIATIILAVIILGVSYAYFSANLTETNKTESVIQTKELKIAFDGTQEIEALNITPGWSAEKKFTVENLTNSKTAFNIYLQNITNEFDNELIYSLYETDSTGTIIETLVDKEVLPQTNADKSYLQSDIELNAQPTKKYYTLKIEFEYKDTPQNEYQGAHFRATVGVDAAARKDVAVISGERIDASSITNGSSVTKRFELLNYSTESQRYDLKLSDVVNTYASGLKYSLKKNGTEVISSTAMPTTDTTLLANQTIASGAKDTYEMTITYDTTQANASGFRLLANEVNTFTAKIDSKVLELDKNLGEKVDLSQIANDNSVTKTFSVINYTSSTKTYNINLNEIAQNYVSKVSYTLKKNNETIATGEITSLNTNILSNVSIASEVTDTYEIEITKPRCVGNECKCIRATSLHVDSNDESIVYGNQNIINGELNVGDAFDCDVNGDGVHDPKTERFYYVSDYFDTKKLEFDEGYAVLVYYNNTDNGTIGTKKIAWGVNGEGPIYAVNSLPTIDNWSNVTLKDTNRNILKQSNITNKAGFDYVNSNNKPYSARLLTYQEIINGCGTGVLTDRCSFLLENINVSNLAGYWLETKANDSEKAWYINKNDKIPKNTGHIAYGELFVRPVIELKKAMLENA